LRDFTVAARLSAAHYLVGNSAARGGRASNSRKIRSVSLFFLCLISASSPSLTLAAAPLTALVSVEPAAEPGHFRVDYALSHPVTLLHLFWPGAAVRGLSWHLPQEGDVALDGDMLVSLSGHPFDQVHFELVELPEHADRQNDPVDTFSDGSAVIFTGLFNIDGPLAATRFHFQPAAGQAVIFLGRRVTQGFYWTPDRSATYVYFGALPLYKGAGYNAVLDPAIPAWLSTELQQDLPAIFSRYRDLFGVNLKETPQIFFGYRFRDQPYLNYVGTAEPGTIRFEIRGAQWQQQAPESLLHAVAFFAHEAVHLWNGGLTHPADNDAYPWLNEGSADALAFDTVHALGLTDDAARLERYSSAFNACLLELSATDQTITGMPSGSTPYDCGAALAFLAGVAVHQRDPALGLADIWKATFQAAAATQGGYTPDSFFAALTRLSGSPAASQELRGFLTAKAPELRQGLLEALHHNGYQLLSDAPSLDDGEQLATLLFSFVMRADCDSHSSIQAHPDHLTLKPNSACHVLTQPYNVRGLGGYDLFTDAAAAYDYVAQQCQRHESMTVNLYQDRRTVEVPCILQPPAMPALIRIAPAAVTATAVPGAAS
jgi:hypothetical protein